MKIETVAVFFAWDGYREKKGCLQVLLSLYWDTCTHVSKRFSDRCVRFEAGRLAAANKAEIAVSPFMGVLRLFMKVCVEFQVSWETAFVSQRS